MKTIKEDQKLMDVLKVKEVRRIICETNMGTLKLCIRKGEDRYFYVLDSVELPKELNKEINELLFPIKVTEELKKEVSSEIISAKINVKGKQKCQKSLPKNKKVL